RFACAITRSDCERSASVWLARTSVVIRIAKTARTSSASAPLARSILRCRPRCIRRILKGPMAVVIASSLRKELSGDPLFDGVSFKVERRDRLALAGANGTGKTTLLRALAGEISLEGGELAFEKGARVTLHDQRPPATSSRPLREYVLAGTADLA